MKNFGISSLLACVGATLVLTTPASADQDRVSGTEKGSLLIYSKLDVRWDAAGNLVQDTFVSLSNNAGGDINVKMYMVNGDEPWDWADKVITLTHDQPIYWSAARGASIGGSPIDVLGPPIPDPEGSGDLIKRAFLYAWVLDSNRQFEMEHNHLSGGATIVNYRDGFAWEYNAWGFQVNTGVTPDRVLTLDGTEYALPYSQLILDFYAVGSSALSSMITQVVVSTDLTLHPVSLDVRSNLTEGPVYTMAEFDIWNEDESKFTNLTRCILCWDQTLLANYGVPNHFLMSHLQSDKGRARIDGVQGEDDCDIIFERPGRTDFTCGTDPADLCTVADPLLGVHAKFLTIAGGVRRAAAGGNLIGLGTESGATVQFDTQDPSKEATDGPTSPTDPGPTGTDWFDTIDAKLKEKAKKSKR